MRVPLWCKIFGHKFYYIDFHPTHYKHHVGITYDFETLEGYHTRRDVTFCTRCGRERAEIVEEKFTSTNQASTQCPIGLHEIKVNVKPRRGADPSNLQDAKVWYQAVKDTYLYMCEHLGLSARC